MNSGDKNKSIESIFKEARNNSYLNIRKLIETLQKSLITLSTAAIGFSITFINNSQNNNENKTILWLSWLCFIITILSVLISYFLSIKHEEKEYDFYTNTYFNIFLNKKIDSNPDEYVKSSYKPIHKYSKLFNFSLNLSMISFLLGIIFTVVSTIN